MNLTKKFDEYIYGIENFSLRFERFCEDVTHARSDEKIDFAIMLKWLEAAYRVGAEDMANGIMQLPEITEKKVSEFIEEVLKNEQSNP